MREKDMNIMNLFKNLKKRIEEIDIKSKEMSKEKCYSSNPFAFQQQKTYVWIEKPPDKKCND